MSRDTTVSNSQQGLLLLAGAFVLALAPVIFSQDPLMGWSTDSATVVLVEVKQSETRTAFVLKNNSDKSITALAASYTSVTVSRDYFEGNQTLSPGATWSIAFDNRVLARNGPVLHVSAVIFSDGNWEGDQKEVFFIGGTRLGRVTETERVKSILETLPVRDLSDTEIEAAKGRIGDLPDSFTAALDSVADVNLPGVSIESIRSAEKWLRRGFKTGVRSRRDMALREMNRLAALPRSTSGVAQTPQDRFRSRARFLTDLRERYQATSARNQELLRQNRALPPMQREVNER